MLTYTTYSEAGGVGKTTTAANLAHAHAKDGLKTLIIDLDPQEACVSYIFGVDDESSDPAADNLVRHLIGRSSGDFRDLIRSDTGVENIDVLPSHNMLTSLDTSMRRAKESEEEMHPDPDYEWPQEEQLYQLIGNNRIHEEYDVIICDPKASEGQGLYNAIMLTQTILIPAELSGKGELSIVGLEDLVTGLESNLGIEVGVVGVVPMKLGNTTANKEHLRKLEEDIAYDVPVAFRERDSMMQEMWDSRVTAYDVVEEKWKNGEKGARRERDHELETLEKYDDLAARIREEFEQ